jgi:hypothetical protein
MAMHILMSVMERKANANQSCTGMPTVKFSPMPNSVLQVLTLDGAVEAVLHVSSRAMPSEPAQMPSPESFKLIPMKETFSYDHCPLVCTTELWYRILQLLQL